MLSSQNQVTWAATFPLLWCSLEEAQHLLTTSYDFCTSQDEGAALAFLCGFLMAFSFSSSFAQSLFRVNHVQFQLFWRLNVCVVLIPFHSLGVIFLLSPYVLPSGGGIKSWSTSLFSYFLSVLPTLWCSNSSFSPSHRIAPSRTILHSGWSPGNLNFSFLYY